MKGAFTGANENRQGLFQAAHGGTLFMDEIGNMGLPMQVKLYRVLQEGKVRPVGSTEEVDVDVRVIAATNKDFEKEILVAALQSAGGVRTRAAQLLKISYRSFRHYAKKHNV